MDLIQESAHRVSAHTSEDINERIKENTVKSLELVGFDQERIEARLRELDKEWDIERAIQANASTLALVGLTLGVTVDKKWFVLPGVVASFLLQHAVQGWCPPVPILRRLGFRTPREIEKERMVLLARRGDFERLKELTARHAIEMLN